MLAMLQYVEFNIEVIFNQLLEVGAGAGFFLKRS